MLPMSGTVNAIIISISFTLVLAQNAEVPQNSTISCRVGDIVENSCTKCTCSSSHIYECSTNSLNQCKDSDTGNVTRSCEPNIVYVLNATSCVCNSVGNWPHEACSSIFGSFGNAARSGKTCEPNFYVIQDCNVCKCGPDGFILQDQCTQNDCSKSKTDRIYRRSRQLYGTCKAKSWYSLSPCQLCYCVAGNKLYCSIGDKYAKEVSFGDYNLSACGEDFVKEALALVPADPNDTYLRFFKDKGSPSSGTNEGREDRSEDESDDETEEEHSKKQPHDKTETTTSTSGVETSNIARIAKVFQPYLPDVVNKVFKLDSRKSIVSIDTKSTCEAGTTSTVGCNVCFCMKNNKLLCTNSKCQKKVT